MQSMPSFFRLRSAACTVPLREALNGKTLLTMNSPSRHPLMASPTTVSASAWELTIRPPTRRATCSR